MIEINNVSMAYDDKVVVHGVNLVIPESGITVLVGPNGAGKSTLLCGMGRLLPLLEGQVRVDGKAIDEWKDNDLAKAVAILRQENPISIRLTVKELVLLGRFPHSQGRPKDRDYEVVYEALSRVHMEEMADDFIDEISGGQRQRAFMAMTLAQESKYLLLDEPLSSLDMRHASEMMGHLSRIAKQKGISVVIVIHDINMAAAYADTIIALKDGRVVAQGSPEEILDELVLKDVFDCPVDVGAIKARRAALPKIIK